MLSHPVALIEILSSHMFIGYCGQMWSWYYLNFKHATKLKYSSAFLKGIEEKLTKAICKYWKG